MSVDKSHLMKERIRDYFRACNNSAKSDFSRLFREDAIHYLPKGMFGPIRDPESLFEQWRRDAEENGSHWILEKCYCDADEMVGIAEWTAVKPAQEIYFRGVDVFLFGEDFLIKEVRVYYATARNPELGPNELGEFDYASTGWWVPGGPV